MDEKHFTDNELFPWLRKDLARLWQLDKAGKLAHAYLFSGEKGLGKTQMAKYLAQVLLCENSVQTADKELKFAAPCHQCQECLLYQAGSHPDITMLVPEGVRDIKIDQVRQAIAMLNQTSQRTGRKIVIINPAEALNLNAANALLKVLEEPSGNSLLILISDQPTLLLPTIKSRCHEISLHGPGKEALSSWLEEKGLVAPSENLLSLANYSPLKALRLSDEDNIHDRSVLEKNLASLLKDETTISQAAHECSQFTLQDNLENMLYYIKELILASQMSQSEDTGHVHMLSFHKQFVRQRKYVKPLHEFYTKLIKAKKAIYSKSNINENLLLESLFFEWSSLKYIR